MEITKFDHSKDTLSESVQISKADVIAFRNKVKDFLKVYSKNPENVNIKGDVDIKNLKKSEVIEGIVGTFTVEEMCLIMLTANNSHMSMFFNCLVSILKGDLLREFYPDYIAQEKIDFTNEEKGPGYNPFSDISDKPIF